MRLLLWSGVVRRRSAQVQDVLCSSLLLFRVVQHGQRGYIRLERIQVSFWVSFTAFGMMGAKGTRKRCSGSFISLVPVSQAVISSPNITARDRAITEAGAALVRPSAVWHVVCT